MGPRREAFFLGAGADRRFCVATLPHGTPRGAVLHVHAFAEELNRSRRMVALAAQSFAAEGWLVLQIDHHGCGDSEGDFGDASWASWLRDLDQGLAWLADRAPGPVTLWTLRSGSLLAASWLSAYGASHPLLCWQPVLHGKQYLTQFLRIRVAGEMADDPEARSVMAGLRSALQDGQAVMVAGYTMSAHLARDLEASSFSLPTPYRSPVTLLELAAASPPRLSPALDNWIEHHRQPGSTLSAEAVHGPKFWQTPEVETAPELLVRSIAALEGAAA